MEKRIKALKATIDQVQRRANGRRVFGSELRREIVRVARLWLENGGTVSVLADALGLHETTLHHWLRTTTANHDVVRVVELVDQHRGRGTVDHDDARLVAVLPSGIRVEGLRLSDVIELASVLR